MGYFVGVDGGGTNTRIAVLSADSSLVVDNCGGPSNFTSIGKEQARRTIRELIVNTVYEAGLELDDIQAICLCLAGVHSTNDESMVRSWLPFSNDHNIDILVFNDVVGSLAAGTNGQLRGITCIAGTGMNCWGTLGPNEAFKFSGGFGPLFGDSGGGYSMGQAVLNACARASDGRGPATSMLSEVWKGREDHELIAWRYSPECTRDQVAQLAMVAMKHADSDKVAMRILQQAAEGLAEAVCAVADGLRLKSFDLVLGGSIWKDPRILQSFRILVQSRFSANIITPQVSAEVGAALLALKLQK